MFHKFITKLITGAFIVAMASPALAAETIKIGSIQPLTDWGAAEGNFNRDGARIAMDKINAEGGINGKMLEIFFEDGRNDPADSLNAAQKLINRDKVSAMFGCWLSSATLAVVPTAERVGVPFIVEVSGAEEITHPAKNYVYRLSTLFSQEAEGARKAVKELGVKKVTFIAQDNDFGRGSVEAFIKMLKEENIGIGEVLYVDAGSSDFYPMLTKIKNSDADLLVLTHNNAGVAKILEQKSELGMSQKVLATGGSVWPYTLAKLNGGKPSKDALVLAFFAADYPEYSPNPEEAKYYADEWKKRGLPWDGIQEGSRAYEAVMTIAEALRLNNGDADRKALRDALAKVDRKGITGHVKFDEFHDIQPNIMVLEITGEKGEYEVPAKLNAKSFAK